MISFGGGEAYPINVLDSKLDEAYKKNWLWFLFNINRFVFVLYGVSDQFKAVHEKQILMLKKAVLTLVPFINQKQMMLQNLFLVKKTLKAMKRMSIYF
nr:aromatic motif membrane protein [Mycoplasmopsis bovis]